MGERHGFLLCFGIELGSFKREVPTGVDNPVGKRAHCPLARDTRRRPLSLKSISSLPAQARKGDHWNPIDESYGANGRAQLTVIHTELHLLVISALP